MSSGVGAVPFFGAGAGWGAFFPNPCPPPAIMYVRRDADADADAARPWLRRKGARVDRVAEGTKEVQLEQARAATRAASWRRQEEVAMLQSAQGTASRATVLTSA